MANLDINNQIKLYTYFCTPLYEIYGLKLDGKANELIFWTFVFP